MVNYQIMHKVDWNIIVQLAINGLCLPNSKYNSIDDTVVCVRCLRRIGTDALSEEGSSVRQKAIQINALAALCEFSAAFCASDDVSVARRTVQIH